MRPKADPRRVLANNIEREVRARPEANGYRVSKTGHNQSWDLWCEGVRVEVKGSRSQTASGIVLPLPFSHLLLIGEKTRRLQIEDRKCGESSILNLVLGIAPLTMFGNGMQALAQVLQHLLKPHPLGH